MTYDLKVILKYCGRSSHDLLVLCGWSWPLSGHLLAVLCHSRSLCWRSWAVLRPKVAQTLAGSRSGKRIWAEKWPKPEREGRSGEGTEVH